MPISVVFTELQGSPVIDTTSVAISTARRQLKTSSMDEAQKLLFEALALAGGTPHQFPWNRWLPDMFAVSGMVSPFGGAKTTQDVGIAEPATEYEAMITTINYSTPNLTGAGPTPPGIPVEQQFLEPSGEMLTQDPSDFRWGSGTGDSLKPQEAPGLVVRGFDYVIRRREFGSIPPNLQSFVGSVNSTALTATQLGSMVFAKETLLFNPPTIELGLLSSTFSYTLRFTYRPAGWNKFWRAKSGQFEAIFNAGGGVHNSYPLLDFSVF